MPNDEIYHTVTLKEARVNPAYWQVVANAHQEQIVRILQRNWRSKHNIPFPTYQETLKTGEPRLRFLKEPRDTALAEQLAEKIRRSEWTAFDFSHVDFERAIYQALRLNYISANDLATALSLYHLQKESGSSIKQFSFENPYRFTKIPYQRDFHTSLFNQEVRKLKAHERHYFSINLNLKQEAALFYMALTTGFRRKRFYDDRTFLVLLRHYLEKTISDKITRTKLTGLIYALPHQEKTARTRKMCEIAEYIPVEKPFKKDSDMAFLLSLLATREPLPLIELSPNHQEKDPTSPSICIVVYHAAAMTAFHRALFNDQNMSYPFFTAGTFSTRFIRYLDETPEIYKLKHAHRPIELPHTDLIGSKAPHKFAVTAGINLLHDYFHWFINSENMFKDFYRYLRQIITASTNFDMTKSIWSFSDMDTRIGKLVRIASPAELEGNQIIFIRSLFKVIEMEAGDPSDEYLLLMIDLIIHTERWNNLLYTPDVHRLFSAAFNKAPMRFYVPFNRMENIIKPDMPADASTTIRTQFFKSAELKSPCYYLLAFHLSKHPEGIALLKEANTAGLQHFFTWQQNKGISVHDTKNLVREMDVDQLIKELRELLAVYKENPAAFHDPRTSKGVRRI